MAALDWTHKELELSDIRKLNDFYIFTVKASGLDELSSAPLMVKDKIFEERIKTYFLKDAHKVSREEILKVKWNMYISKGYYVKISRGEPIRHDMESEKYYVSYLEVAGPLGTFTSISNKDKEF
jgi:hypothetical protein